MTKAALARRKQRDKFKLNFRLEPPLWNQLKRLADEEDRTMPYFARAFIKAGLDGVRNGNTQ
jgi:hypothetical protein